MEVDMAVPEERDVLNTTSFELLEMTPEQTEVIQEAWEMFLDCYESTDAAGEALHDTIIDAAPTLTTLFTMPRAVAAMRFQEGLHQIINSLAEPDDVKNLVDILGFKHLNLELTVARVEVIRDAILELMGNEMGPSLTPHMAEGVLQVLNYVGGALIYIRSHYAERVKILNQSWEEANCEREKKKEKQKDAQERAKAEAEELKKLKESLSQDALAEEEAHEARMQKHRKEKEQDVPRTFFDMFCFNAAVMDLLQPWMYEVLDCFDIIVLNAGNTFRLQEECDILTLKMAKVDKTPNLSDFKAVMLASLRSLIPKGWTAQHEAAWTWLWEHVESLLQAQIGRISQRERLLTNFFASLDDESRMSVTWALYGKFFELVPAGQEYFKQSASRLAMIANRVLEMSLDLFKYPYRMVDEISALGLRHVGYNVPIEYFGPFVSACIETLQEKLEVTEGIAESFAWSVGIISRMLVRTIKEGSTIVMKAINQNDKELLRSALSCAPRGARAEWVLTISVGTQSISPLLWAVESGTWKAAELIIEDLLTIRADREQYYYGLDDLFERHPDFVEILATKATSLLKPLFDGMIWRSHLAHDGLRRGNYYIKHLVVDAKGNFPDAMDNLVRLNDPQIALHPLIIRLSDVIWTGVVRPGFLRENAWLLFTLFLFVIDHGMLHGEDSASRSIIFLCRVLIYVFAMPVLIHGRVRHIRQAVRDGEVVQLGCIPVPQRYVDNWREPATVILALALLISLCLEPILYCANHSSGSFEGAGLFTSLCPEARQEREAYNLMSMVVIAMYMALLMDLATLSRKMAAYVLVALNVLPELFLLLISIGFLILMFATCIAVSRNDVASFQTFPMAILRLFQFSINTKGDSELMAIAESPLLCVAIGTFVALTSLGSFSIFVAQLTCAHHEIYANMVGFAGLRRMQIEVGSLQYLKPKTWKGFVEGLRLDEALEFGEGDIGLAGGIQLMESAYLYPQHRESIQRFGGSTSPQMPWPRDRGQDITEEERIEMAMRKFQKAVAVVAKKTLKSSCLGSNLSGLSFGSRKGTSSASKNGSEEEFDESSAKSEA